MSAAPRPQPVRRLFFSLRLALLFGLGGIWLTLTPLWVGFFWLGVFYNLALAALGATDAWLLRAADRVSARRELELPLSLGRPNRVVLALTPHGGFPLQAELRDEFPHAFKSDARRMIASLSSGQTTECIYHLTPLQRGSYRFGALVVRFTGRLRLLVLQRRFPLETQVKVYPNILETKKHRLLAQRHQLTQMGLRPVRRRGTGLEFESLRHYVPGDPPSKLDWKASARCRTLISRQYQLERNQRLLILLDSGRTMASRGMGLSKLDYAVNAAMLLAYVATQQEDRVGLMTFADDVLSYLAPGKGSGQLKEVMELLYRLQPRPIESDYRRAFLTVAQRLRQRSLLVLFTDLIDPDSSKRIISQITPLLRNHLLLCVALSDYEWGDLIRAVPQESGDLYRQAVAISILEDRKKALAMLAARGVLTLDAAPADLSVATINRYLKVKRAALL